MDDDDLYAADLDPGWRRWMPCGIHHLTVQPEPERFRLSAWEELLPWEDGVWCDPGDVSEWRDRIAESEPESSPAQVAKDAQEAYAEMIRRRSARIEQFAEICQRSGLPVPHTVRELFRFCVELGLFELSESDDPDPWVMPRLYLSPLDVLPLTREETITEAAAQWDDRVAIVGMLLGHLAEEAADEGSHRTVGVSLRWLAETTGLSPGQVCQAIVALGPEFLVKPVPEPGAPDGELSVTVDWDGYLDNHSRYHLAAPEHDF